MNTSSIHFTIVIHSDFEGKILLEKDWPIHVSLLIFVILSFYLSDPFLSKPGAILPHPSSAVIWCQWRCFTSQKKSLCYSDCIPSLHVCFNKQLLFQEAGMWLLAETNVCLLEIVFILRSTFAVINLRDLQLPSVCTGVFVLCFISLCEFVYVWGLRSMLKVTIWKYNVLRDTLTSICVPVFLCYSWFVGVFV